MAARKRSRTYRCHLRYVPDRYEHHKLLQVYRLLVPAECLLSPVCPPKPLKKIHR